MAYDNEGKWINPPSVGRYKIDDKVLFNEVLALSDDEYFDLLATIRTGEKLDVHTECLRWWALRRCVRQAFRKRWLHYYQSKTWYKAGLNDYHPYDTRVYDKQLGWYPETQRILDLWDFIKNYPFKESHNKTARRAITKYFMSLHTFETVARFKYHLGISFTAGRKSRNYTEEYIPYTFALYAEWFVYAYEYDFIKVYRAMMAAYAEKYDRWLKGELTVVNARSFKPSPAKALNLYANLWRHFAALDVGTAISIESIVGEDDDEALDWFVEHHCVPIHPVLAEYSKHYARVRKLGHMVRRNSKKIQEGDIDLLGEVNALFNIPVVLPARAAKQTKPIYKQDRKVSRSRK